ncbi:MAG: hypothetical protein II304_06005 [Bacteroidales bacterium]|nr:hypothetical protein [Bacteroidales bacterium]
MEFYIYWDEDYNGSDRDELLGIVNSEEEKEKIIDNWCTRKAGHLLYSLPDEDKEIIKNMFRKQLFVMNEPRYK